MAFVWVQQWIALPLIVEEPMGDLPPEASSQSTGPARAGLGQDEHRSIQKSPGGTISPSLLNTKPSGSNAPFQSQISSLPSPQTRTGYPRSHSEHLNPQQGMNPSPFNMGALAGALPEYSSTDPGANPSQSHHQSQRPVSGASTPAVVYQLQQIAQFPSQPSSFYPSQPPYGIGFNQGQYAQNFASSQTSQHHGFPNFHSSQQRSAGLNPLQSPYQGFQQPSQYMYYPSPYMPQGQFPSAYSAQSAQPAQHSTLYGRRASLPATQLPLVAQPLDPSVQSTMYPPPSRLGSGGLPGEYGSMMGGGHIPGRPSSDSGLSTIPRGPPRKPKQSGHALWVGNLPPGTTVIDLKDHFSRDATRDIESLFLISKSNCAFVNYRTETSCTAAMHRFHDSRFHGVRLVCRLRRSSAPTSGIPTGPSAMSGSQTPEASPQPSPKPDDEEEEAAEETSHHLHGRPKDGSEDQTRIAEKFFVVKSLTLQDLELSVRNGIWATQSHNEETLNKAYKSADNVYLIFSANKSGEYFGYARMASPILEDASQIMETVPKPDVTNTADVPKSIPTPATEFAPKGRIIDDSARGTIFWEADLSEFEDDMDHEKDEATSQMEPDALTTAQSWGKPFRIEWISINRLPFYRTRGLRNPWNANREVKIARDGTELETSVGKRLVQMFHRLGPSSAGNPSLGMMPNLPATGVQHPRPF